MPGGGAPDQRGRDGGARYSQQRVAAPCQQQRHAEADKCGAHSFALAQVSGVRIHGVPPIGDAGARRKRRASSYTDQREIGIAGSARHARSVGLGRREPSGAAHSRRGSR